MPLDRITQPQTSRDGLFIAKLQEALERCSTLIDNIVGSWPDIRPIQNCRLQANDVVLRYAFRIGENLCYSLRDSDLFGNNVRREPSYEQRRIAQTSSIRKFGSGEMTVRPEKSTRLPDKLPLKRPCLPFRR